MNKVYLAILLIILVILGVFAYKSNQNSQGTLPPDGIRTPVNNIQEPSPVTDQPSLSVVELIESGDGASSELSENPTEYLLYLIKSPDDYVELYNQLNPGNSLDTDSVNIDFTESSVVLVVSDVKPSGGFSVEIESITIADSNELEVTVLETTPGDCIATTVITRPYTIGIISATEAENVVLSDVTVKPAEGC